MQRIAGSTNYVNGVLRQLFQGHGVEADAKSGRLKFPAHPRLWADGELFTFSKDIVQLDVRLCGFDGDRVLAESIGGFGADVNAQATFALQAFANASFHVLLPAFFGRPPCHGTQQETWTIGGPRTVYPGPITTIFGYPPPRADGIPNLDFYPAFKRRLETYPLPVGTHWIRIYQMRQNGAVLSNEVLLNNDPWHEMQAFMGEQPWPVSEKACDVRVFLVIKDVE